MNRIFSSAVNNHQDILRYVAVVLLSLIISWLFPRTGGFKYDFETGKPWRYESLIASFDFGIYKTKEETDAERKKLLREFVPYYALEHSAKEKNIQEFIISFNRNYNRNELQLSKDDPDSSKLISTGISLLEKLYFKGIINLHDEAHAKKDIHLLESPNTVRKTKASEFLSLKEAYQNIESSLEKWSDNSRAFITPLLEDVITYNIVYDDTLTSKLKNELLEQLSLTRDKVQEGEMIISKGSIVTQDKYQVLFSYKTEYEKRVSGQKKTLAVWVGNFIITLMIMFVFTLFLKFFSPTVYESNRKVIFIYFLLTVFVIIESFAIRSEMNVLYALPFCIVPIISKTFFGPVTALHTFLALMLLSGFIIPQGSEFIVLQMLAGMVAIFTNIRAYYWSRIFISIGLLLLTYFFGYFAISLSKAGNIYDIETLQFGWLILNVLLVLLAYPFIPLFEKMFGFVSEITLLELSDINKPLLKELSIKAPGTFQHSLQVANLAEAAAFEIGANTLLVKTGALYHDIGKMQHPEYFIENQSSGANPHDDLNFEESARIIISHVSEGIVLAKQHKLPDIIIDFIRTHHGSSRVEYFYQSFLKNFPNEAIDESLFTYPGPLPYSKETAIVMMADTVEAAARSLKNPTADMLDELVEKLIGFKIEQQQFINCNITFKEINSIKKVMKKMLHSIYHARVEYPAS